MNESVAIARLDKDLKASLKTVSREEARHLVNTFYVMQQDRLRDEAQERELEKRKAPRLAIEWLASQHAGLENRVKQMLKIFAESHPVGEWMMEVDGIGPVIAAGVLAHVDIERAHTAGHIWRIAGLDPTVIWPRTDEKAKAVLASLPDQNPETIAQAFGRNPERVQTAIREGRLVPFLKRIPWNPDFKRLCFLTGECFMKVSNKETAFYGHIYRQRKVYEEARNQAGEYAGQAARILREKRFEKDTTAKKCYEAGRLPPGHINRRAQRYAVKLFLSHVHTIWYELHFRRPVPQPYAMVFAGHAHYIPPPNWPMA